MRINHFLGGLLAALALNNLHAQDNAPPKVDAKAENKTAVTPVENIKLNGVSVPLNIKTLAEIQRLQEEQAMREELQAALKIGGSVSTSTVSKPQAVSPAPAPETKPVATVTPSRTNSKAAPAMSANTLLGVYGTTGAMTAEIQTAGRNVRTLREGEQLGKFNIKRITHNGLELVASNGNTQHVSVGAQVRF
ncbi:MAG: hypothetical protein KKC58_07005 [Gammaproteobacteria bacterium]|jgi:type IV pilus biogenesis protein PilP|nr:hypothetical protein [uncultured Limnobacter sp.]MBU0542130.1 hypothetical protein [Gammaproteobacteria bacterium]